MLLADLLLSLRVRLDRLLFLVPCISKESPRPPPPRRCSRVNQRGGQVTLPRQNQQQNHRIPMQHAPVKTPTAAIQVYDHHMMLLWYSIFSTQLSTGPWAAGVGEGVPDHNSRHVSPLRDSSITPSWPTFITSCSSWTRRVRRRRRRGGTCNSLNPVPSPRKSFSMPLVRNLPPNVRTGACFDIISNAADADRIGRVIVLVIVSMNTAPPTAAYTTMNSDLLTQHYYCLIKALKNCFNYLLLLRRFLPSSIMGTTLCHQN